MANNTVFLQNKKVMEFFIEKAVACGKIKKKKVLGGLIGLANECGFQVTNRVEARKILVLTFGLPSWNIETQQVDCVLPNDADFLQSYQWKKVRMQALTKYGARCHCCGATPKDGVKICVDHIKPRRLFPHLALDICNLQILCEPCNHGKGNWDMTDWRPPNPAFLPYPTG